MNDINHQKIIQRNLSFCLKFDQVIDTPRFFLFLMLACAELCKLEFFPQSVTL